MRNPDVFEAIDPAALTHVNGGFAQMIGAIAPLIGMLAQKKQRPGPQMTAQAQAQPPQGQPPAGQPQMAAPAGGDAGGDGRVQVTVATGQAAVSAAEALKASIGAPKIG